jgi:hypothetical protein
MKLLAQVIALLDEEVTLDTLQKYDALADQASGEEAAQIGDMYETLLMASKPEVHEQYLALHLLDHG